MKIIPFDVEKAKSGKYKIQTKDGKSVRILCWDRKTTHGINIVGLADHGDFEVPIIIDEKNNNLILVDESTLNIRQRIFDIIIETCTDHPNLLPTVTPLSAVILSDFIQEGLNLPKWKFIEKGKPIPETSIVMSKEGRLYGLQINEGTKLDGDFWYLPISEIKNLDYEM